MATAEELLAAETGTNKVLTIDSDLRTITIPSGFGVFGVESDDNVHCVHFRGPRYYHEVDLSTFRLRVNIANAKGEEDSYPVTDMAAEGDTITFSWLIGRFAAQYKGDIKFSLCFKEIDSEGITTREFNTTTATGRILEGLETGEAVVQEYPDVLEGILLRLESLEENDIPAGGGGNLLIVTLDENEEYASHSASEINEHINNGGIAVLEVGSPMTAFAYPHYRSAAADQVPIVVFSLIEVITNVTQILYTINDDKSCVISEEIISVESITQEVLSRIVDGNEVAY